MKFSARAEEKLNNDSRLVFGLEEVFEMAYRDAEIAEFFISVLSASAGICIIEFSFVGNINS